MVKRSSFFGFSPWDTFSKITLPKAATIEYKNRSPLTLLPENKINSQNRSPAFFINDSSKQNLFYKQFYLLLYTQYDNCKWGYIPIKQLIAYFKKRD
jgi:hypothetical protein